MDMQDSGKSPTLQHVIPTIAHMGVIAWRPQRETYIAGTALTNDFSVNVWDLRRPYIPFASFEKHVKVVTTLMWRMDPHILMTGSQDGCLTHFTFQDAKRPADQVNPVGLDIGCYGDVAQACSQRIRDGYGHHGHHDKRGKKLASIFAESTSAAEDFPLNAVSSLSTFPHDSLKVRAWYHYTAESFGCDVCQFCLCRRVCRWTGSFTARRTICFLVAPCRRCAHTMLQWRRRLEGFRWHKCGESWDTSTRLAKGELRRAAIPLETIESSTDTVRLVRTELDYRWTAFRL